MKIKQINTVYEDYQQGIAIEVDGQTKLYVTDGEPEDSNLSRNFNGCYQISDLMLLAYEAGKRGDTFDFEQVDITAHA